MDTETGLFSKRGNVLEFLTSSPTFILVCLLAPLWLLIQSVSAPSGSFRNQKGKCIKQIKRDIRYERFSHGKELSHEGELLAGDEPYLIWNGWTRQLVITQPDHLKEFYNRDGKDHMKPPNMNLGDAFGRLLGECLGLQGGSHWKTMRALFDPAFSHTSSVDMISTYVDEVEKWADQLNSDPSAIQKPDRCFIRNATEACRYLPFRLTAMTVYKKALTEEHYARLLSLNDLHEKLTLDAFFGKLTVWSSYNMLPTASRHRMNTFREQWEDFNLGIIQSARKNGIFCPAEGIYKGVEGNDMSQTEFLQTMDELLFTNIDVTSTVIAFLLLNTAKNQEFQSSLREEIKRQKSQNPGTIKEYLLKQDTLLHFAAMESVRMSPALWFSLPEKTAQDKVIGGYFIPAQTPTVIDWARLNSSTAIWGADGEHFRPERFAHMSASQYRYGLLRFGMGRGRCLGKNIADMMLKLSLLLVVERFVIKPREGESVRRDTFTVTSNSELEFEPI